MIAVAEQPPKVTLALEAATDAAFYIAKRRTLVIYHTTGDRIVALIEILSPGNKHSQRTIDDFLDKVMAALREGYHVLVIDLFPPGRGDPSGIHGVIWEYRTSEPWQGLPGCPLTLAAYCAKVPMTAYVEPINVGSTLPDMPLFLTPAHYIYVPLEQTYMVAWRGVPQRWRRVIEQQSSPSPEPGWSDRLAQETRCAFGQDVSRRTRSRYLRESDVESILLDRSPKARYPACPFRLVREDVCTM